MVVKGMKMGINAKTATVYGHICAEIATSGQFVLGAWTMEMETIAAHEFKAPAVAYSCCTDATTAALRAINCKVLIMPALSFSSSILAAEAAGVEELLFIDCDEKGINIEELMWTLESCKGKDITFLLSHFGGGVYPNSFEACTLVRNSGGFIIEDFSHSWGAFIRPTENDPERRAGMFGDIAVASLFATKPIHCGVGAVIIDHTEGSKYHPIFKMMREYGRDNTHGTSILNYRGGSWRMSEMEAALFCCNYSGYANEREERIKRMEHYNSELPNMIDLFSYGIVPNGYRAFYRTEKPEELTAYLKSKGISLVGRVYDAPVTASPIFAAYNEYHKEAQYWCDTTVCLPLYATLTEEEQNYVIKTIRDFEESHH